MNIKGKIKKFIGRAIRKTYKLIYKYIPIDNKTIMFIAYHGRGYLCNPKYLHKYLISNEMYNNYKFIWAIKKKENINIPNAKIVKYNGVLYFYYLARSKYWIVNCKLPSHILKKEKQVYIQTWHGTPLKKLAHDINIAKDATFYRSKMSKEEMTNSYDNDVKKYDYLISPNKFSTECFKSAFKIDKRKIIEIGYPRNDYLTNISRNEISKLKSKYNIPKNKKVILYAPTWRDNNFNNKGYLFELKANFKLWKKTLGNEYVVLFKPHYLIINNCSDLDLNGFLHTISENADINELYVISDILITDYSSVFFDYAILKRPILFYMYDLEEYKDELRGFYLDINKELPGKIFEDENMLLNELNNIDKYKESTAEMLEVFNKRYNYLQDGFVSKKVIERVLK